MDHKSVFAAALVISFIAPLFLAIPSADAESVESELIFTYTNPESDNSQESAVAVSENGNTAVVLSSDEKNFLVFDMQQKILLWRTSHYADLLVSAMTGNILQPMMMTDLLHHWIIFKKIAVNQFGLHL